MTILQLFFNRNLMVGKTARMRQSSFVLKSRRKSATPAIAFGFALHLIRQNTERALVAMRLHAALTKHDQFTAAEAAELNRGRWDGD